MGQRLLGMIFALLLTASAGSTAALASDGGRFVGEIVAKWSDDGRNMMLTQPFTYIDPVGLDWTAPKGAVTDGASVPRVFWSLYGPFEGKYRAAAVLHDYYCQAQLRAWQATHNMFYEAMLTAGVSERDAKIMWAAVYSFGPRWGLGTQSRGPAQMDHPTLDSQKAYMHAIESWVDRDNPSRDTLAHAIDKQAIPEIR